ncbi:MAG: S41 family peptidase [Eubacteriales bacterium]|nr:S41 family peptidase [Eubacteriales bacterium]
MYERNNQELQTPEIKVEKKSVLGGKLIKILALCLATALIVAAVLPSAFPYEGATICANPSHDSKLENSGKQSKSKQIKDFGDIWEQFDGHPLEEVFKGKTDEDTYRSLGRLLDVYSLIKDDYYKDLSDKELLDIMLKGLCNEQDSQYTFYLSPEENERVNESNSGEYSGIGAIVQMKDNYFQISDLVDDSPAAQSGLRIGDQFLKVDEEDVTSFADVQQLAAAVRGPEGTKVVLTMFRPTDKKEYEFKIERKKITNANLRSELLQDSVGYIRIVQFNQGVAKNFISALNDLQKQGMEHLVIDLRNNPGGYVSEVTSILDYMLPKGLLATAKGRRDGEEFSEEWTANSAAKIPNSLDIYVLVNENSASASELLSGVMQYYERATIIGRTTWGKGVGSISFDLDDGSGVQITNFHYYLPNGVCIQDIGITPDIEVETPEEIQGLTISQIPEGEDVDLNRALSEMGVLDD